MIAPLRTLTVLGLVLGATACSDTAVRSTSADPSVAREPATAAPGGATKAATGGTEAASAKAEIGQPAPDFKLKDLDGKEVSLASLKGKTVVLEWFNPGCPFVQKSHQKGSLKGLSSKVADKGVVWIAINSGAPGKQGAGVDANRAGAKDLGVANAIYLDEDGAVGKAYGATNTPHMYIIDAKGTLVYAGAIDNSPDAEGESPEGGKLVNYVESALDELGAGKPVTVSRTKAYGCSVKYGS
jgi:peroxiredoxin